MQLVSNAHAQGVTIVATVGDGGGDWAPLGESYPIVLGWGVELSAPGVYFLDPDGGNSEIFAIAPASSEDVIGHASIVGTAAGHVGIGMSLGDLEQSSDLSAIEVEPGNTLYIALATVGSTAYDGNRGTNAITVAPGGALLLGQDRSAGVTGTVNIGSTAAGWNGIVCQTDSVSLGCTISDAPLVGQSSVVIQRQAGFDIDAEGFASISLISAPVIGLPPARPGFMQCQTKADGLGGYGTAVQLKDSASMTFSNGTVQCVAGIGFMVATSGSLTLSNSLVQNAGQAGIFQEQGTVTVSGSVFRYNAEGTLGGRNTIVCSSDVENFYSDSNYPSIGVQTTAPDPLNASNVDWDTPGPDVFDCDGSSTFQSCTCATGSCILAPGTDGMDAVQWSTGPIITTGNGLAHVDCTVPSLPDAG
jgi:hypothetical protein